MPDTTTLMAFALASLILIVVPGPTVALVVARSLAQGRRTAFPLAAGVALGDFVAASLSLAGVGALLAASATLFTAVKWAGALYLVWIAVRLWREPVLVPEVTASEASTTGARYAFRDGFLVTVFNPKGIVFFIAFVPQFIDPALAYAPQAFVFVFLFTLIGALNVVAYALGADRLRRIIRRPNVLRTMTRTGAAVIGGAGIATLFASRA